MKVDDASARITHALDAIFNFYEAEWSTLIISIEYLQVPFLQVLPVNDGFLESIIECAFGLNPANLSTWYLRF